jgi:hypothetical protein
MATESADEMVAEGKAFTVTLITDDVAVGGVHPDCDTITL